MKSGMDAVGNTVKKVFNAAAAHSSLTYLAFTFSSYAAVIAAVVIYGDIIPDPIFNTPSPDVVEGIKSVCSCGNEFNNFINSGASGMQAVDQSLLNLHHKLFGGTPQTQSSQQLPVYPTSGTWAKLAGSGLALATPYTGVVLCVITDYYNLLKFA